MFTVFSGGAEGPWQVTSTRAIRGEGLPPVAKLNIGPVDVLPPPQALATFGATNWQLAGVNSNRRYVNADEKVALLARHADLGRPQATRAVLIPMSKSAEWWDLAQDERRVIFETQSRHISGALKYLPAVARKLYHSRDLGGPFDFLTWFEFAPEHEPLFDELLAFLRGTPEWNYVTREVELRLQR